VSVSVDGALFIVMANTFPVKTCNTEILYGSNTASLKWHWNRWNAHSFGMGVEGACDSLQWSKVLGWHFRETVRVLR